MQSARDALCLIQRAFCFFTQRVFALLVGQACRLPPGASRPRTSSPFWRTKGCQITSRARRPLEAGGTAALLIQILMGCLACHLFAGCAPHYPRTSFVLLHDPETRSS